jgi:hypothetical protein
MFSRGNPPSKDVGEETPTVVVFIGVPAIADFL